jgi:hypothetical protein
MPFEVFNPWGTDANGWAPGFSGTIYGRFWENAAFLSQNFSSESLAGTTLPNQNPDPWARGPASGRYDEGLLPDEAFVLQSLLHARGRSPDQSAVPGGPEHHHGWSSQQMADWVFTADLLAPPLNS